MSNSPTTMETRVAVLVDCDNVPPDILQFGRVVLRRGYSNQDTLANKWQDALVRLAFIPGLQHQYAADKNTADLLALCKRSSTTEPTPSCLAINDSDVA